MIKKYPGAQEQVNSYVDKRRFNARFGPNATNSQYQQTNVPSQYKYHR